VVAARIPDPAAAPLQFARSCLSRAAASPLACLRSFWAEGRSPRRGDSARISPFLLGMTIPVTGRLPSDKRCTLPTLDQFLPATLGVGSDPWSLVGNE